MLAAVLFDMETAGHFASTAVATPPFAKRAMRAIWSVLPRCALSYNLGKLVTRTLLRPSATTWPVLERFGGKCPMVLDLGSFVANDLYCLDDHYEAVTLRLWRRLARQSRTILDVGSHIGTFALVAAAENQAARIIAVEATSGHFTSLRHHSAAFPNVIPVQAAIADRATEMWFCADGSNDGGGYLSVERPPGVECQPVATRTLEQLCAEYDIGQLDLMKLDVEGFEHKLLAEDREFWRRHAPTHLIVEITSDRRNCGPTNELFRAMARRGYRAQRVQGLYTVPWGKPEALANWHFTRGEAASAR